MAFSLFINVHSFDEPSEDIFVLVIHRAKILNCLLSGKSDGKGVTRATNRATNKNTLLRGKERD